ncbi:MAG: hypothetical protein ACKVJK_00695 [Methylophagaceae bacterium]
MAILQNTVINSTGNINLPSGTTAQRPATPADGDMRFNTDLGYVEYYFKGFWGDVRTGQGAFMRRACVVQLDATLPESYPGSGTVWTDLSGSGNNFNIVAAAYVAGSNGTGSLINGTTTTNAGNSYGVDGYMNFNGSHGCAKNATDISLSGDVTYYCVSRVQTSTSEWRTLTRSYTSDHHVIIQSGGYDIGVYDNDVSGFIDNGANQNTDMPCQGAKQYNSGGNTMRMFNVYAWSWSNNDNPTHKFFVNGYLTGTITNSNARYNRGFGSIGGYHSGNTTPSTVSQNWGDIKFFSAHADRHTDEEIRNNTASLRHRFGI